MNFHDFKKKASHHFNAMMKEDTLFRLDINGDAVYEAYLNAFHPEENKLFRERTEHDCSACRRFIKVASEIAVIRNGKITTMWDFDAGEYQHVVDAMKKVIRKAPIANVFVHPEADIGLDKNVEVLPDGTVTWEHLYGKLPNKFVKTGTDKTSLENRMRGDFDVLLRSLTELSLESAEIVKELINQNSLYRGAEHLPAVKEFIKIKMKFDKHKGDKTVFVWEHVTKNSGSVNRFRNTVIGTLVDDLTSGVALERAVASFESKVAPHNYKRTTALVTKGMIEQAKKKVEELGLTSALERRHATYDDISVNDILFIDRDKANVAETSDVFADLLGGTTEPKKLDKVEEVNVDDFISKVLPSLTSVELLVENRLNNNTVSILAPANKDAPNLFKWNNGFSWAYNGDVADSIKERVKRAGGVVDAVMRCSLSWFNYDDLDLHCKTPDGLIYFGNKYSAGGRLDVDMNAGAGKTREAVENIYWADTPKPGIYTFKVNNFSKRENVDVGFEVEFEFNGEVIQVSHPTAVRGSSTVEVLQIRVERDGTMTVLNSPFGSTSKNTIGSFKKVNAITLSPNHWGEQGVGNKHLFFLMDDMKVEEEVRGFFNEYLRTDLTPHRKVFEILGSKTKVPYVEGESQLCGYGFSETVRNHVVLRVTGKFTRTIKVVF